MLQAAELCWYSRLLHQVAVQQSKLQDGGVCPQIKAPVFGQTSEHLCTSIPPSLKWDNSNYFIRLFPGFHDLLYLKH